MSFIRIVVVTIGALSQGRMSSGEGSAVSMQRRQDCPFAGGGSSNASGSQ